MVILAVDETGDEPRVLLERQYRYAAQEYLWELPAGRIDPGENALAGAKRELIEETGYRAKQWKRALNFYASPGFLDETMAIYPGARSDARARRSRKRMSRSSATWCRCRRRSTWSCTGKIHDGKAIAGVLWLAESLRRGEL